MLADLDDDLRFDEAQEWRDLSITGSRSKSWLTLDRSVRGALVLTVVLVVLPADWLKVAAVLALMVGLPLLLPLLLFLLAEPFFRHLARNSGPEPHPPWDECHRRAMPSPP